MNTKFTYQYRDACNYKKWAEVIVHGEMTLADIQPFLYEGEFFIPSMVGLEDLQDGPWTVDDHPWHEVVGVEYTEAPASGTLEAKERRRRFFSRSKSQWQIRVGANKKL